ncbi:MAG: hypothetical protein JWO20_1544 [Candidatus Angelobacter sp.]|jgi:glycosyltransferase involved in cell wall biosynthesis/peptidoglycan/xylan/chitin deacetylase (PgdA/CDA1 family)|nr:hypothetical protein [Candidatus Angelobacter sp.]
MFSKGAFSMLLCQPWNNAYYTTYAPALSFVSGETRHAFPEASAKAGMENSNGQASAIKISVVIATFDRRHILARTLPTLFQQDFPADQYEIVVVIDGSSDGTAEMLARFSPPCIFRYIEQPNQGPGVARNTGIKAARGEIILFLDDDFLCDPGLLREHFAAHQSPDASLIIGRVLVDPNSATTAAMELCRRFDDSHFPDKDFQPDWPIYTSVCSNTSLPRSTCLEFGGYDENFSRMAEDLEFGFRLHHVGIKLQYRAKAVCHEIYDKTTAQVVAAAEEWGARNDLLLCRKYPAYRSHSQLAVDAYWVRPRAWIWRSLASLYPLMRNPLSVCSVLLDSFAITSRNIGLRLLIFRKRAAVLAGAKKVTGSWKALAQQFGRSLPVLLYHHVGPHIHDTPPELTISPEDFKRQVKWLAKSGYHSISTSQWTQWCTTGTGLPHKPVMLTFDDAYADLCEFALPILHEHGFTAGVMVVTGLVGKTNEWNASGGAGNHKLMTAEQIRFWNARGFEFGAHGRTHADLQRLHCTQISNEVEGSKIDLSAIIGMAPRSFAYPYGQYNECALQAVRKNFDVAFSVQEGLNTLSSDLHTLRRTMVQPRESLFEFGMRVRHGKNPFTPLRIALSPIKKLFSRRGR